MDFHLGGAFAGIYQAGNFVQNLRFLGGRYGIVTEKTSPAWQFTVLDSSFEGQTGAAIREHEAGLTLVDVTLRNVPVGIEIDPGYGDSLWGKDVRFEGVRQAGVVISNEGTVYTQVGFDNALARDTPLFVRFRDSGRSIAGQGRSYRVRSFSYGLAVPALGQLGQFATSQDLLPIDHLPRPALRRCGPCRRSRNGPMCVSSAPWAMARPTTPWRCSGRSMRTAPCICRWAFTGSAIRCGCGPTQCWSVCIRA